MKRSTGDHSELNAGSAGGVRSPNHFALTMASAFFAFFLLAGGVRSPNHFACEAGEHRLRVADAIVEDHRVVLDQDGEGHGALEEGGSGERAGTERMPASREADSGRTRILLTLPHLARIEMHEIAQS